MLQYVERMKTIMSPLTGGYEMKQLSTAWCRIYQWTLKIGNYFMGYRSPECMEGRDSSARLPKLLNEKGINDVLVVTGTSLLRRGMAEPMLRAMEEEGIRHTVLPLKNPDPTSHDVELGYRTYVENGCKSIVALGGGSRIDCAKGIAARVANPRKSVPQMQGLLKVHGSVPPFVAIPTTSGAGSETTVAAVITDSQTHRKAAINSPKLIPQYAVLDPVLTVGLPPFTTATTGMDALAHAVEAYTNHTYNTKLENDLAREAVRLIHENLLIAYRDGSNLTARQNMQKAAFCAGRAFTRGCVGYVHAIGHTLGGLYGVAHGLAMAVLLPNVMGQYGIAVHKRLAELADICEIPGSSDWEKAENFLAWIWDANRQMGIPDRFDMIRDEDIPQMIAWAMKEANPLYPVPVVWNDDDFRKLIDSVRS